MDTAAYQSALKEARPAILKLLAEAPLTKDNSFTNYKTGEKYITTKWLFQQPQVHPYRNIRHGITQNLQNEKGISVITDKKGFIVAISSKSRIEPFIKQKAPNAFSSGAKPPGFKNKNPTNAYNTEDVYEAETESDYSSTAGSFVFTNRNAHASTSKSAVKTAFKSTAKSVGSPNNYAKKTPASTSKSKNVNESSTNNVADVPMGSEVQDAIYRALLATDNDAHAAFDLLPEAVRKYRVKTVNELIRYIQKTPKLTAPSPFPSLESATINLLKNMCPTKDNSGLVDWRKSGEHKLLFRSAAVYQALPHHLFTLKAAVNQKAYEAYLWNAPRFSFIMGRYVHLTELLSQMPTEEELEREIKSVMWTAFGCSMTLPRLHRSLQPRSRIRVVTERSLKNFLLDHQDSFVVDDGNVVKMVTPPTDSAIRAGSVAGSLAGSLAGASQADSGSVADDDGEDPGSDKIIDVLPDHPIDLLIVQRCTYLVLIGKWKATESACSVAWLRDRLAVMPPVVDVGLKQLADTLRNNNRFVLRADGGVRVAGNKIPMLDDVEIITSLSWILYKAHERGVTMDKCKLLDAFNSGRRDCIVLSMSLLSQYLREKEGYPWDSFRLEGHNVYLSDKSIEFFANRAAEIHKEEAEAERNKIPMQDRPRVYDSLCSTLFNAFIEDTTWVDLDQLLCDLRKDNIVLTAGQLTQFLKEKKRIFNLVGDQARLSDFVINWYAKCKADCTSILGSASGAKMINASQSRAATRSPELDHVEVYDDLCRILYNAHELGFTMDMRKLLETFNSERQGDDAVLSITQLSRFLRDETRSFCVEGQNVYLTDEVLRLHASSKAKSAKTSGTKVTSSPSRAAKAPLDDVMAAVALSGILYDSHDKGITMDKLRLVAAFSSKYENISMGRLNRLLRENAGLFRLQGYNVYLTHEALNGRRAAGGVSSPIKPKGSTVILGFDPFEVYDYVIRILYDAHEKGITMDKRKLLDTVNSMGADDGLVLSMGQLSKFLRDETGFFRVEGHNVYLTERELKAHAAFKGKVQGVNSPAKAGNIDTEDEEEEEGALCSYMTWQGEPSAENLSASTAIPHQDKQEASGSTTNGYDHNVTASGQSVVVDDSAFDFDHLCPDSEDNDAGYAFVPPDDELVQKSISNIEKLLKMMKF